MKMIVAITMILSSNGAEVSRHNMKYDTSNHFFKSVKQCEAYWTDISIDAANGIAKELRLKMITATPKVKCEAV